MVVPRNDRKQHQSHRSRHSQTTGVIFVDCLLFATSVPDVRSFDVIVGHSAIRTVATDIFANDDCRPITPMPTLSFTFTLQNDPQAGEALDTPFQAYDHPQFPEGRGHEYIHLQERTLFVYCHLEMADLE